MSHFDGKRVSGPWAALLTAARKDGVQFVLNSGRRTLPEQTALFRQNMIRPGVPRPGRPMTAVPSPTAPHIRTGRIDHAIDVHDENGFADGGGFERLQDWAAKHGVHIVRTVPTEAWHGEAPASELRAFARRWAKQRSIRLPAAARRMRTHGIQFIAGWEGFVPYVYNDAAGHATVGYGHLLHFGNATRGDRIAFGTKEHPKLSRQAGLVLLHGDIRTKAADHVRRLVNVELTQNEFEALVSLVFNIGGGSFAKSTVLSQLNKGHRKRAALAFLMWNKAGGRTLVGLSNRRRAERKLFLTP